MANFDSIGEFSLSQVLAKRLTTPGGSVSPTVAPELFPCLTLENDRPEWGWAKGEGLRSRLISVAALAANYSMCQLYLPTTRRSVAVVTAIHNVGANICNVARAGIGGGLGGWVASTTGARDLRDQTTGGAVLLETNQNAALPASPVTLARLTSAVTVIDQPFVLGNSGSALYVYGDVVNQALQVVLYWYERAAQPGELV